MGFCLDGHPCFSSFLFFLFWLLSLPTSSLLFCAGESGTRHCPCWASTRPPNCVPQPCAIFSKAAVRGSRVPVSHRNFCRQSFSSRGGVSFQGSYWTIDTCPDISRKRRHPPDDDVSALFFRRLFPWISVISVVMWLAPAMRRQKHGSWWVSVSPLHLAFSSFHFSAIPRLPGTGGKQKPPGRCPWGWRSLPLSRGEPSDATAEPLLHGQLQPGRGLR